MKWKRALFPAFAGVIVVLTLALTGCGGGDEAAKGQGETQSGPSFIEILSELKRAAASGGTYNAVRRTQGLAEAEKAVVDEFCNNVFQIQANGEVKQARHNRPYVVERVTRYAAYERGDAFAAKVTAAMDRLQKVINLGSLDGEKLKRYERACYH